MFKDRTAGEVVMLILTLVVAFILVFGALGIALVELFYPEQDTDAVIAMMFDITKVIVGAVIGFAAGKAVTESRRPEQIRTVRDIDRDHPDVRP